MQTENQPKYTHVICSVYDNVAKRHDHIKPFNNLGEAIRAFKSSCTVKESPLCMYPQDFEFHKLAELNMVTGEIMPKHDVLDVATNYAEKDQRFVDPEKASAQLGKVRESISE